MFIYYRRTTGPETPVDWSAAPWPVKVLHGLVLASRGGCALVALVFLVAMILGAIGVLR